MRANAATSHLSSTQDYIHEDFREYGAAPAAVATDDRWDGWLKGQPPVVQQAAIKFRADCERARSDDREMLNLQVEWFRLNKNQALCAPTQEIKTKRLKNVELIKALRARQKGEAVQAAPARAHPMRCAACTTSCCTASAKARAAECASGIFCRARTAACFPLPQRDWGHSPS